MVAPEVFLVGALDQEVVASVMVGYEGHRGWINYLQHRGRQIMNHAETLLHELGSPKINLMVRSSNVAVIEFYEKLGFSCENVVCMGKRLIKDEPSNAIDPAPAHKIPQGVDTAGWMIDAL